MDPKPKKIMVDPDPPHGYCCKCGAEYRFPKGKTGSDGITEPYTYRICLRCLDRFQDEIQAYEETFDYLQNWLEDLQTLIDKWPEGGSLSRFQDILWHTIQAQIENLQKDPEKRGTPAVEARYALDREKVMML